MFLAVLLAGAFARIDYSNIIVLYSRCTSCPPNHEQISVTRSALPLEYRSMYSLRGWGHSIPVHERKEINLQGVEKLEGNCLHCNCDICHHINARASLDIVDAPTLDATGDAARRMVP